MIIKRKFKSNLCVFEDLQAGEVFRLPDTVNIYMKLGENANGYNGVNLESGACYNFPSARNCLLLPKAKITVTIDDCTE